MIIIVTGPTHVGKTLLADRLMRAYGMPYVSQDHLKMALIRSGQTALTPVSEAAALTAYLWPVTAEWIRTAVENGQSLIVEGCYVPGTWAEAFAPRDLAEIRVVALVMTDRYLTEHYDAIVRHRSTIEARDPADVPALEALRAEHRRWRAECAAHGVPMYTIDGAYTVTAEAVRPLIEG